MFNMATVTMVCIALRVISVRVIQSSDPETWTEPGGHNELDFCIRPTFFSTSIPEFVAKNKERQHNRFLVSRRAGISYLAVSAKLISLATWEK